MEELQSIATSVLASNSPRRRELLGLGGVPFAAQAAEVDESVREDEAPEAYVLRLAEEKARAIAAETGAGVLVLAADTTVVHEGEILGKPVDAAEAHAMLNNLRGRRHQVYTGIALLIDGELATDLAITEVPMRTYSDAEMDAYIASGDPFDKAGGYAIQNADFHPVEQLEGCYANVIGLPLCHIARNLAERGLRMQTNLAEACQAHLHYDCPVYEKIQQWEL